MKQVLMLFISCYFSLPLFAQEKKIEKIEKKVTINAAVDTEDGKKVRNEQIVIQDSNGKQKIINMSIVEGGATDVNIVEDGKTQNYHLEGTEAEINAELKRLGIDIETLKNNDRPNATSTTNDTTKIKVGGVEIIIHDIKGPENGQGNSRKGVGEDEPIALPDESGKGAKDVRGRSKNSMRFLLFDLGISTYLQNGSFDYTGNAEQLRLTQGKSLDWNLHIFRHRISLYQRKLNLQYGLGIDFNNYHFSEPITLVKNTTPLNIVLNDAVEYKTNKLYASYLHLPLMLNFESNPSRKKKSLHLSAGIFGDILLGSRTKQCLDDGDNDPIIRRDDYHLNTFRYGLGGQLGYGPINFYANYSLKPLFQEKAGGSINQLYPLNIGISLLGF